MRLRFVAALATVALAACGSAEDEPVVGPDDYEPFGSYFTMDESVEDEMTMDGGQVTVDPRDDDPHAAILAAQALPDDPVGAALTSQPENSPAVR